VKNGQSRGKFWHTFGRPSCQNYYFPKLAHRLYQQKVKMNKSRITENERRPIMAITRWRPANDLMTMWNDFDRLFNRLTRSNDIEGVDSELSNVSTWSPVIDITEREKDYVLSAEVPGLSKDDVSISLKDNVLTLKGEKKLEYEENKENRFYRERSFGTFQRMIRLDSDIDSEKVNADYENGVLTIILPKTKETMHKEIPVNFKK